MDDTNGLNPRLINMTMALIATSLVVYIFIVGRSIFLPVLAAIVVWYLIIRLASAFKRIPFTKIELPFLPSLLLSFLITAVIIYAFVNLMSYSIAGIVNDAPKYQDRLTEFMGSINSLLPAKLDFKHMLQKIDLTNLFTELAGTLTSLTGNIGLITIYVLFLLLEHQSFDKKLKAIFKSKTSYKKVSGIVGKISSDINTYLKVKTWVSLLTAVLSYFILLAFGIHYAQFWAILIFMLNYIPTLGSIISVIVTLLAVSIQVTTLPLFVFLAILLIAVHVVVGGIIEPKFLGEHLNLSPMVILISLGFWGSVWGIFGMFLCVPLMTILNIILEKFDSTRSFSVLLSANPEALSKR